MKLKLCAVALVATLSTGAQAAPSVGDPYELGAPETNDLGMSIGQTVTVTAGDAVISTRRFRRVPGAVIEAPVSPPPSTGVMIPLPTGSSVYAISTKRAFKGCATVLLGMTWPPCLIDDDGDGTFDRMAANNVAGAKPLSVKVPYRKQMVDVPPANPGFQRNIIFQGSGSEGLRFSYREFANDFARPAFEEQLSIPVTSYPQQFAIKGLVFTAEKVTPMGLTVRLDSVDLNKGWPMPSQ